MLEKFSAISLDAKAKAVKIKFPEGKKSAREVIKVSNLSHSYGTNQVLNNINFTLFRSDKAAFVGLNGSGKSTLSRLISLTEKPTTGNVHYGNDVNAAFFSQESSENLNYEKSIWEEVNNVATKASDQEKRNLLGAFLFSGDDIHKSVAVLSGGEKSRLALLKILLLDTNFLILDEPTNHLDLKTKDIFQEALINYHGTLAIVSHDRYFLDQLVNKVFELHDGQIHEYHGNYSYFIEKRCESTLPPEESLKNTEQSSPEKVFKTKEQKRQEAEERNKQAKTKNAWKKELAVVEKQIEKLETEKSAHESALCDPQVLKDSAQIIILNKELKKTSTELEQAYNKWTELSSQLEEYVTTS
jgi:ATP-binding cassette subfamily F protein 3